LGNAVTHQEDGQNVLFMDGSMRFEDKFFCGINEDNIYTYWDTADHRRGAFPEPQVETAIPQDREDSFVVHDGEGGAAPPKGRTCFVADTPVWVNGSLVQISNVSVAGLIETVQAHEGIFVCRDVTLENGECLGVVDAHCFMLESGQWIPVQNLQTGMKLKTANGSVAVQSVTVRVMPYTGTVYNLKINSSDQYMVGKVGVIVRDF
jgi:hypothetical protein